MGRLGAPVIPPDVRDRLLRAVGRPVRFKYPAAEGARRGVLTDRAIALGSNTRGIQYYNVIDLITFDGEPEPWVRITYYRHLPTGLRFAGQYSICEPASSWGRLLAEADTKEWFRQLGRLPHST
jgi:hypothetical protein